MSIALSHSSCCLTLRVCLDSWSSCLDPMRPLVCVPRLIPHCLYCQFLRFSYICQANLQPISPHFIHMVRMSMHTHTHTLIHINCEIVLGFHLHSNPMVVRSVCVCVCVFTKCITLLKGVVFGNVSLFVEAELRVTQRVPPVCVSAVVGQLWFSIEKRSLFLCNGTSWITMLHGKHTHTHKLKLHDNSLLVISHSYCSTQRKRNWIMLNIIRISSHIQRRLILRFSIFHLWVCSSLRRIVTPATAQPFTDGLMADSSDFRTSTPMMLNHGNSLLWEKRFESHILFLV